MDERVFTGLALNCTHACHPWHMSALPPLHVTRRQGLALLAVLAVPAGLSACGSESPEASPVETTAPPAPDLAAVVAGDERALIALYDAALAGLSEADERRRVLLTALRQQHVEHRDALAPNVAVSVDGDMAGGAVPDAEGTVSSAAPVAPGLRDLAAAERKAAKERIRACVEADDPQLARTLAFIAASESSHVPALVEAL